ncbi:recombinase family protein [Spirosoma horti]
MVQRFLRQEDQLIQEFTEVESGRKKDRPQLQAVIQTAKQHSAQLLIAKLDRLSRNASFVMVLRTRKWILWPVIYPMPIR